MSGTTFSGYGSGTYRAGAIPPLPASPKKREHIGEELLPFGDYAGIDPYQQLCEDIELVQQRDEQNKDFYQSDDWWWDHQRIRFLPRNSARSRWPPIGNNKTQQPWRLDGQTREKHFRQGMR